MSIELFHQIDDGVAVVRIGQIWKQTKLFQRAGVLFIPHAGGYVRVCDMFGDAWGTALPKMSVIDLEGTGVVKDGKRVGYKG